MNLGELQAKETGRVQIDWSKGKNEMKWNDAIEKYFALFSLIITAILWDMESPFGKLSSHLKEESGIIWFITLFKYYYAMLFSLKFTPVSHSSLVYMGLKLWGGECKEGKTVGCFLTTHICLEIQIPVLKQTDQRNPHNSL